MARVVADLRRCEGYANCLMVDPDRFDLDPENHVLVLRAEIEPGERATVEEAVASCPTQALAIEQQSDAVS
jgi:ferredoxin